MRGRGGKIIAWMLAGILLAGILGGCAQNGAAVGMDTDGSSAGGAPENEKNTPDKAAMGRYVEKSIETNGREPGDWNSRWFRLEDGSLLLAVNSGFVLRSWDGGGSWIAEEMPWLDRLTQDGGGILSMAVGRDKTAAVVWMESLEEFEIDTKLLLFAPDGTETPVDIELTEDEGWLRAVYMSDTGRIFASTLGSNLYEIKKDGSSEIFLTLEEGCPELVRFCGDLMLLDGIGYETPLLYDMKEGESIEDEVLSDFVEQNYGDRDSSEGRSYDLFLFAGEEGVVYVAGKMGVYRHVVGGSAMEQIIDGSLSVFGNPAYSIMDMMATDDNEFLVLFTGGKMARFVYDPDIPTVPGERLKVYSLEDKEIIRQAIDRFQKANPDVYVEYENGLPEGSSVTRDDALKSINTRILAGEGPDVLILDDMPVDSYIEKGLLADIGPLLEGLQGEEALFPNVAEVFRQDGGVYAVPCEIRLPYVLGRSGDLEKMTDLSGMADVMVELRKSNPGEALTMLLSPRGILRMLAMSSAPAWRTEEGALAREAVADFLAQAKRMYDAEMEGLPEETIFDWERWSFYSEQKEGTKLEDSDEFRTERREINIMDGTSKLVLGSMKNIDEYTLQLSLIATDGFEDCGTVPMGGQCGSVFAARTLAGISAASANRERAQEFLRVALGREVQAGISDGIPVNRQAILDNYADQRRIYGDNNYISGSVSRVSEDGIVTDILIRVPDEAKVDGLLEWIAAADTAYVEDKILEEAVYEAGGAYLQGDRSLEEALDEIEKKTALYLAE